MSVPINVGLPDHFVDLFIGQFLAEVGHDVSQLSSRDEPIAVLVEHTESFTDLLFAVSLLHLASHHGQELWEVNGSVAISVHLVDHVLELSLSGVLAEGTHHSTQFLGSDGAITILVKQGEGLLEFSNLFLSQLISLKEILNSMDSNEVFKNYLYNFVQLLIVV